MTLRGWIVEYGRGMHGGPLEAFVSAVQHDLAYATALAVRLHGVIVAVYREGAPA
jgi:hypothetical protein